MSQCEENGADWMVELRSVCAVNMREASSPGQVSMCVCKLGCNQQSSLGMCKESLETLTHGVTLRSNETHITHTHMHTTHTCIHTQAHTDMHTHTTHTHTCTHTGPNAHTHLHTGAHVETHTQWPSRIRAPVQAVITESVSRLLS